MQIEQRGGNHPGASGELGRPPVRFRLGRTLKLGTFHIGSSAADLIVTAIWNRVMIVDLGVPEANREAQALFASTMAGRWHSIVIDT